MSKIKVQEPSCQKPNSSAPINPALSSGCKDCNINQLCHPLSLEGDDLKKLDETVKRGKNVARGEHLFRAGEQFKAIFAIRAGSLKSYTITDDGEEQINGFYLPGDLVALDALDHNIHPTFAQALESTSVCEVSYDKLEHYIGQFPALRQQLLRAMSREISTDQQLMQLLSKKTAEQRLATWLVSLSERFKRRGYSAKAFRLTMTRADIGNYLGLTVETVSRLFTRLQNHALIKVDGKEVVILELDKLSKVANGLLELPKK